MAQLRILNRETVEELISFPMALQAVEAAYTQKSGGSGQVWPMVFHEFDPGHADLDIKSGNLDGESIYGLKVVSFHDANPAQGLPALVGTSLIFDLATGQPRALLDAGPITDYRTGAAGAIGAKYLARKDSRTLLMAGTGALAPYLIAATLLTLPKLERVLIANPRHPEKAAACLSDIAKATDRLLAASEACRRAELLPAAGLEKAVRESDVILTATPAQAPFIRAEWVRPGTHFSCVGADMAGKQEIDQNILAHAQVFGDDEAQCFSVGECEKAHAAGLLDRLHGELGEVISGAKPGRTAQEQITVFDSTGIALQDLAAAAAVLRRAEAENKGVSVSL